MHFLHCSTQIRTIVHFRVRRNIQPVAATDVALSKEMTMFTARTETAAFAYGARIDPLSAIEVEAEARRLRAVAVAQLAPKALQGLKILVAKLNAWRNQRLAMDELYGLDDAMLRDIGLTRSQIPAAVSGSVYRPVAASNENSALAAEATKVQVVRLVPRHAA